MIETRTIGATTLEQSTIQKLAARFHGALLQPGDQEYNAARALWNGMIDKHPALIARCSGTADVVAAVNFAREQGLTLAVRGGGHNIAGHALCDDGLVIDLSGMKGIFVDPATRTARVQPGVNWGDLDHETQIFGLATPGGIVSDTGVAGLTLGGGFGWMSRQYGLTVDNLLSLDLVTADGRLVTASETQSPDLFWGVRGGGGNFGVVTSFEYRLHAVGPTVVAGMVLYPMEQAPEVLRFFRDYNAMLSREVGVLALMRIAPPAPFLPPEVHGKPVVGIAACCVGSVEDGARLLRPIQQFGEPLVDLIKPKPYVAHQAMLDTANPKGRRYYWKSDYLPGLSDAAISTAIQYASNLSSPQSAVLIFRLGGAISDVPEDATAAGNRAAEYVFNIQSAWEDPSATVRHITWTRDYWRAMQPFGTGGVYVNFLNADEGEQRLRAAYGSNYQRLVALKQRYDPHNLFNSYQNIPPDTAS